MGGLQYINMNSKQEYEDIPVYYCENCLSLKILPLYGELDYCDDCGSTQINSCNIHEWEILYEKKYNKKFLNK